tara:strand:- start:145 stop:318 length:174 start_codon:yes stop_codon:yes gene_type:complete
MRIEYYENKIEQLKEEIKRLNNCCEKHNENPKNENHIVAYKKATKKINRIKTIERTF